MKKLLIDFFPLLLFFVVYKLHGIYAATIAAIIGSLAQIAFLKLSKQSIEAIHWLSLIIVLVFGGLTIYLQDESFIKWKPTILYWAFAAILLVGRLLFKRNLLKSLLGSQLQLPDHAWTALGWMWIGFFSFMGVLNWYIAHHFSTPVWVNFKVWWSTGLLLIFSVVQAVYMSRYLGETVDSPDKDSGSS